MTPVDMGYPGKRRDSLSAPAESRNGRPKALREAVSSWREKGIFITHLPGKNALLFPMKSVYVLVIALKVGDDQKKQLIS